MRIQSPSPKITQTTTAPLALEPVSTQQPSAQNPAKIDDSFKAGGMQVSEPFIGTEGLRKQERPSSGNAALGFHGAHQNVGKANPHTLASVERFLASPLPGETQQDLVGMLKKDPRIARHGEPAVTALAAALAADKAPPAALLLEVFGKTGRAGPDAKTLDLLHGSMRSEVIATPGELAELMQGDGWLKGMLAAEGKGRSLEDLGRYLALPSRVSLATNIQQFFDPAGAKQRAENALASLNEVKARTGGREIALLRDVPPAQQMTLEDAEYVAMYQVNDFRLEEKDGKFTIAARSFDERLESSQLRQALKLLVGDYGTETRADLGGWRD